MKGWHAPTKKACNAGLSLIPELLLFQSVQLNHQDFEVVIPVNRNLMIQGHG
jgi:hypothetical protein